MLKKSLPIDFKKILAIFANLPNGIIVFEKENAIFYNKHIEELLSLQNLPKEKAFHLIGLVLGIKDPTEIKIKNFFLEHRFFLYHGELIQVDHNSYGDLLIFSFCHIYTSYISDSNPEEGFKLPPYQKQTDKTEFSQWLEWLKQRKGYKLTTLLMNKGLPIKSAALVYNVIGDMAVMRHTQNQVVSAYKGQEVTLIQNGNEKHPGLIGTVHDVDVKKQLIYIKDIRQSETTAARRELIRLQPNDVEIRIDFAIQGKVKTFPLYDLAENTCSFLSDETVLIQYFEAQGIQESHAELDLEGKKLDIRIALVTTSLLPDGKNKLVFRMRTSPDNRGEVKKYLRKRQIELIQAIHDKVKLLYGK